MTVLNTRRLFLRLLRELSIEVVADVGSMDGCDALAFARTVPTAIVYAMEPHPRNCAALRASEILRNHRIRIDEVAASDREGSAAFHLVADRPGEPARRGMSSLFRRTGAWAPASGEVTVRTVRLEDYLAPESRAGKRIALWIDTEGKSYEVLDGAGALAGVLLIHAEVEALPLIAPAQRLYPDIAARLARAGYSELARDRAEGASQFNVLFVRGDLAAAGRVRRARALERLRHLALGTARRACPGCVAWFAARRARARGSSRLTG